MKQGNIVGMTRMMDLIVSRLAMAILALACNRRLPHRPTHRLIGRRTLKTRGIIDVSKYAQQWETTRL